MQGKGQVFAHWLDCSTIDGMLHFSEPQFAGPENGAIVAHGGASAWEWGWGFFYFLSLFFYSFIYLAVPGPSRGMQDPLLEGVGQRMR